MFLYEMVDVFSKKSVAVLLEDFRKDTAANLRVTSLADRTPYHYNERRKTLNLPVAVLQSTNVKSIGVSLQKAATALYQHKMPTAIYRLVNFVDIHTHLLPYHGYIGLAAVFLIWGWTAYPWQVLFFIYLSFYLLVVIATCLKALYDMKASAEALHWLARKKHLTSKEFFMVRDAMYAHVFDHFTTSMGSLVFVFMEYFSMVFMRKKLSLR